MPIKIIETEKEGHRKVKTKEPKRYQGQKSDLYGTKTTKSSGKALTGDHPFIKALAGGEKGKPHSSKEGRLASAGRKFGRMTKRVGKPGPARPRGRRGPIFGRTNLLEELGRVEAEPSNRNRRAEISRVHRELNKGYKGGKRVKKGHGGSTAQQHYLQHGYGPHKLKMAKASDKAIKGNKLTKKA